MPQHAYLYLLLVPHVQVVAHLSGQEGIGLLRYGLVQEEVATASADGHALDGAREHLVVHQALAMEHLLHSVQEEACVHGCRQVSHHTAIARGNHVDESQALGHLVVYPVLGLVQVGMGTVYGYVVLYGQAHHALNLCGIAHLLQAAEEHGMVAHYEVAPQVHRLAHHLLGDVQTQ